MTRRRARGRNVQLVALCAMLAALPACGLRADRAARGIDSSSTGEASTCDDARNDVPTGGLSDTAPDRPWLDLTAVTVEDSGETITVTWELAGAPPNRAELADGTVATTLWAVMVVPPNGQPGYALELEQTGDRWLAEILGQAGEGETEVDTPDDPRTGSNGLSAEFPTEGLDRLGAGTGWFALAAGDEAPEGSETAVIAGGDRCPDAPDLFDRENTLPLR